MPMPVEVRRYKVWLGSTAAHLLPLTFHRLSAPAAASWITAQPRPRFRLRPVLLAASTRARSFSIASPSFSAVGRKFLMRVRII